LKGVPENQTFGAPVGAAAVNVRNAGRNSQEREGLEDSEEHWLTWAIRFSASASKVLLKGQASESGLAGGGLPNPLRKRADKGEE